MKNKTFWNYLFGGWSVGKLRIWPWKAEAWARRTPNRKADIKIGKQNAGN